MLGKKKKVITLHPASCFCLTTATDLHQSNDFLPG